MDTNEKVFELLEKTGLNWDVEKRPLFDKDGNKTNSHGIFKKTANQWLGTVGDRYTPLQNSELAMILIKAAEGINLEITRGGMLQGGEKVYLQAALPDVLIGNSNVKRLLTTLNSHDGSTSVGFGSTNTTVVCQNTFYRAYGEIQKFRHTTTMLGRIEIAQKDLRTTLKLDEDLITQFKRMADMPVKDEAIERVIRKIFQVNPSDNADTISTRKANQINNIAEAIGKSYSEQGMTIWALFNGVTRYVNHIAAPKDSAEKKLDFVMANGGANISNLAFNELMDYVVKNTATSFSMAE